MPTANLASNTQKSAPLNAEVDAPGPSADGARQLISPVQRWKLISENVYLRAQKRGFVGGDPLEDLLAAEREVDATYETDFEGVFTSTDVSEITKQLKCVFAGQGCDDRDLDDLMAKHQDAVERLAKFNRRVVDSTSELAVKQTNVLEKAASEAAKTLQSFSQGWITPESVARQAELSMQAIENTLSHFRALSNSMAAIAQTPQQAAQPATPGHESIKGTVAKAYETLPLSELAEAPAAAIKGISKALGAKLEESLGIRTIRDMASNKAAEWASGMVLLADTEDSMAKRTAHSDDSAARDEPNKRKRLRAIADGPVTAVQGLNENQAELLREALHIKTVRDLANHRFFSIARAIVMLADAED